MTTKTPNRLLPIIAAVAIQLCLGIAYIWSVFQTGIAESIFSGDNAAAGLKEGQAALLQAPGHPGEEGGDDPGDDQDDPEAADALKPRGDQKTCRLREEGPYQDPFRADLPRESDRSYCSWSVSNNSCRYPSHNWHSHEKCTRTGWKENTRMSFRRVRLLRCFMAAHRSLGAIDQHTR